MLEAVQMTCVAYINYKPFSLVYRKKNIETRTQVWLCLCEQQIESHSGSDGYGSYKSLVSFSERRMTESTRHPTKREALRLLR